jgi:hypothetical protein
MTKQMEMNYGELCNFSKKKRKEVEKQDSYNLKDGEKSII